MAERQAQRQNFTDGRWAGPSPAWCALGGAVLFGTMAHGMGMLNKFAHHDEILAMFRVGTTISSGRWMLHVLEWLVTAAFPSGPASLPLSHGLISLVGIGACAGLISRLFRFRSRACAAALGGLMAVFPVITGFFGYLYTMPYYILALLMTVGGVCLICGDGPWWHKGTGILLGGCATGIYQAFVPLLVSLPILYDIHCLASRGEQAGRVGRRLLIQGGCVAVLMMFYFAANRFFLAKFDLTLNSYMGINEIDSFPLATYFRRVGTAYREFFLPTRNVARDMYPMHLYYLYGLMLATDGVLAVRLVRRKWREKKSGAVLMTMLLLLLPLGCNFIFVMSEKVHGLMTYGQTAQFVLLLWGLDGLAIRRDRLRRAVSGLAAAVLALTGVMYIRFDNQCYLKAAFQQQQAISFFTTLISRVKSAEGYRADLPVVFLQEKEISDLTLYNMDELDFIHLDSYGDTMAEYVNSYAWYDFMARWCGFDPPYGDPAGWSDHPEVRQMPHYPDDGSIRRVEDRIIVRF